MSNIAKQMVRISRKTLCAFYDALIDTIRHDGIEHAGYLSFLFMLSIFPFLVFFVAMIGSVSMSIDQQILHMLTEIIVESELANFITALKPRIMEITTAPPANFLTLAIVSAIWTASSIFEALRTILNRAYRVTSPPAYIMRRFVSIIEFMMITTLTAAITVLLIFLPPLWKDFSDLILEHFAPNIYILRFLGEGAQEARAWILTCFGIFFILYLYCFLPNKKQKLLSVLPGTFAVFVGWYGFSMIFKYYISSFPQINFIYGSIAGVIIALLYFYFCSLILIYGAELNYHVQKIREN